MENVITPEQKKAAYVALTDTLSLEQMQLLNTVIDVQEVCPNCSHTYPDSTALDEPLHPRYVAGYKAGHKAGRRRDAMPVNQRLFSQRLKAVCRFAVHHWKRQTGQLDTCATVA